MRRLSRKPILVVAALAIVAGGAVAVALAGRAGSDQAQLGNCEITLPGVVYAEDGSSEDDPTTDPTDADPAGTEDDGPTEVRSGHPSCLTLPNQGPIRDLDLVVVSTNGTDPLDVEHMVLFHPGGPGGSPGDQLLSIGLPLSLESAAYIAVDGASSQIERGYCGPTDQDVFTGQAEPDPETMAAVRQECTGQLDTQGGSSIQDADDWVRVLDALGIEKADVLSHSYGTLVSEAFIRRHPSRVGRVVADAILTSDVNGSQRIDDVRSAVDAALPALLTGCPDEPECPATTAAFLADHPTYEAVRDALLDVDATVGAGADTLTPAMLDHATLVALRSDQYWSAWYRGIEAVLDQGNAALLFTLGERDAIGVDRKVHFVSLCASVTPPRDLKAYALTGDHPVDAWLTDYSICSITVHPPLLEMVTGTEPATSDARNPGPSPRAVDLVGIEALAFGSATDILAPISLTRQSTLWAEVPLCDTGIVGHTSYPNADSRDLMAAFLGRSVDAAEAVDQCPR